MSGMEGEQGGLWLEPAGYVLTVKGGTSKVTGTDGTDLSNHYQPKDTTEETGDVSKDVALLSGWNGCDGDGAGSAGGKGF